MKKVEDIYFERGIRFFELEQYENALMDWIKAYELGYDQKIILQNLYECFVIPNDTEFRNNFNKNNNKYTSMDYEDCELDFIPVSEKKYFIFDKKEMKFEGNICCENTCLMEEKLEFNSVLYTDTWDIREIVADIERYHYGLVYLLLENNEEKFISYFKLPLFKELYMNKIILFHDLEEMGEFFKNHERFYIPQKLISMNISKYKEILWEIEEEKNSFQSNTYERNILFIKGQSQYGVTRRMIDDMALECRKLGYNTFTLDGLHKLYAHQLEEIKKRYQFDAVISFNAMGLDFENIRKLGRKFCAIMGDHPIWHCNRLSMADKNTILWYGDLNDVKYVKKFYPNVGRVEFCLASSTYLKGVENYDKRKINIVMVGGYTRPQIIYDQICEKYNGKIGEMVNTFINYLIQNPKKTYEEALEDTLKIYGVENIEPAEFNELAIEFELVNKYIRAYYRDRVIRKIVENGIKIHVSGNGWENFESDYKDNLFIEKNDWYTARKLISNAKISLNIMPWFKNGFHERAIISLLSGSLVLTDSSKYIEDKFKDMKNIAIFHLENLDEMVTKIKYLLSDKNAAKSIANQGYEFAKEEYTWDLRAKQMMKILQEELGEKYVPVGRGHVLSLGMEQVQRDAIAFECMTKLKELEEVIDNFEYNEFVNKMDYEYCVNELKKIACEIISAFPDADMGNYVWRTITNMKKANADILELIKMQLAYLLKVVRWNCLGLDGE